MPRLGWRIGRRRLSEQGDKAQTTGLGAAEGAIFGLMGILVAFTFTGAASRFNERRDLITDHVNAIGTAWIRTDLLPEDTRETVRQDVRSYVDTILEASRSGGDEDVVSAAVIRAGAIEREMWPKLICAVKSHTSLPLATSVLPSINEIFDLTESRLMASRQHPPSAIFVMLGVLVLVSAFIAGFGMARAKQQSLLHVAGFAAVMSLAVYLILDLEFPRIGVIRLDSFNQNLIELLQSID